jgi:hypothetical protein
MTFDIRKLFGPDALNMLLQPTDGRTAQNLLLQMPDVKAAPLVAGPQPDPMTTAAMAGPAPQTPPQPAAQVAGGGGRESFGDKYRAFWDTDNGQYLRDTFNGWAMGKDMNQSLALGAQMASTNARDRTDANQTVEWLKGRGMDEQGAKMLASNPKALGDYLQQINKPADPGAALDMEYKRAQIDALRGKPQTQWQRLDDDTLFNPATGESRDLAAAGAAGAGGFRYGGKSVEAQSLNGLMDSGRLTPEQAQELGAGKTITGPNGEIIFMTPQGVFSQPGQGAQAGGPQPTPMAATPAAPVGTAAPAIAPPPPPGGSSPGPGPNRGLIPLTTPKNNMQLPAEMGARIGMGDAFLEQLPRIRESIARGDASGPIDGTLLKLGIGGPASLWRDIETGRDALVRNLTGAGMSESEAKNQTARYQIDATDSSDTMLQKLGNLERDLRATRSGAIKARTGGLGDAPGAGNDPLSAARAAIAKGAPRDAVIQRLRQSGINPEGL